MGPFFSNLISQKSKTEIEQNKDSQKNESNEPLKFFISIHTQSIIEQQPQCEAFSFNEQQKKDQQIINIKENINGNKKQSQEAIVIDQSGNLTMQQNECLQKQQCYECRQIIDETLIQLACYHTFHQNCFIQIIEKQLKNQEKFIIKCKCGTKLNSNILRQIVDEGLKSKILYKIFSLQVQQLLQYSNIRKLCNVQQMQQLIESNTNKEDYDFQYNEKKLELQNKITQQSLNQSGILLISEQNFFIRSVCLECGKEINQNVLNLNCGHQYHQNCIINWLQNQIEEKRKTIIKCRCGTKINTSIIRRIPESLIRLKLLNYLFSKQLEQIIPHLRKKDDFEKIWDLFYLNQYQTDYEYDNSSGFMYSSYYSTPGGD